MVGWGKKDVRLKPDMDPRKKAYGFKFGIPVKVNVADTTSKTWKPVQIDRESAKIHSLPFISEIPESLSTGYYPLSKMTLIDIDLNEGHAVKLTGNKPKAAPDNQTTKEAAPASSKALNLDLQQPPLLQTKQQSVKKISELVMPRLQWTRIQRKKTSLLLKKPWA